MNRRSFIKSSCGTVYLLPVLSLESRSGNNNNNSLPVRFGLITDLHFAESPDKGSRYYSQSNQKLLSAIQIFNDSHPDFIIELGDFKDQDEPPEKSRTLAYLDEIEGVMRQFNGPVYHVLGNHDMDSISKRDFLAHTKNHGTADGKSYYSFTHRHIKFIVLDANCNEDGSDYNTGNFDWTYARIPDSQVQWLNKELAGGNNPVIVFVHQLLDWFSDVDESLYIKNAETVVETLEKSSRVLAVFQGHHHSGNYSYRNGIHYFTMNAAVEGNLPENNSFAMVEIDSELNIHIKGFYNCENRFLPPQSLKNMKNDCFNIIYFRMKYFVIASVACCFFIFKLQAAELFVEAESFSDKGGWVVDQQFMDQMGSPYLMAHGIGQPVKDASTAVTFPCKGVYRMFVRTFNWTSPWFNGKGPGQFQVLIDGEPAGTTFGNTGDAWLWQDGGKVVINNTKAQIALHDLTGFKPQKRR